MTRSTILALLLVCALLAGVLAGAVHVIRDSRADLVGRFADQRLAQVSEAARLIDEDLENIGDDLLVAGALVRAAETPRDQQHELGALLAVVEQYKLVRVYDTAGHTIAQVMDPLAPFQTSAGALEHEMDRMARAALLRPPGDLEATPPITAEGGWFRVFSTSFPINDAAPPGSRDRTEAAGAVSILVDTEPLFSKLRLLASEPSSALLVLGLHGRPIPVSDPGTAAAVEQVDRGPGELRAFADLVAHMRRGDGGTFHLPASEATALGLGQAEAVAAYASIQTRGGGRWSIATLNSTLPLRVQERALVLRLGLAAGVVGLALLGFGVHIVTVSRRDAALRERLRHAGHLAHLHEKTEKILDHIPAGVMALSDDARIATMNRVLRERLPANAIGADLSQGFPDAPVAVIERIRGLVDAARGSGRVRSIHGEHLALFGEEGQYSIHAVPLEAGFPEARLLLVIEDVSEVRALTSQLLRAEKLATVGVLAAGIAHEIGTPLGVVRGRAEYILGKLGEGHAQAGAIGVMIDQIDVVTRTIRQLLDFSRVKPALVQPIAVGPVARAVAELLRFEAERRKVSIEVRAPEPLPPAAADADQLQQVLVNLVMNACDACKPGGHVGIDVRREERAGPSDLEALRIAIVDDGCGIAPEHREQVFDPFFTTKKRGQGTGLGLTIAAQIVRNHGGRIEIESESEHGTNVTLLWPTARKRSDEDAIAAVPRRTPSPPLPP